MRTTWLTWPALLVICALPVPASAQAEVRRYVLVAGVNFGGADRPQLRYAVSWGATELIGGRAAMTDEQWVAMGLAASDDEYYDSFQAAFGLDLRDMG